MPVNAQRVSVMFAYALPGPPQTFSAKEEAIAVVTMTHQQMRYYRAPRGFPARSIILAMLLQQNTGIPLPNPENVTWTGEPVKIEVSHDEQRESREDAERRHGARPQSD